MKISKFKEQNLLVNLKAASQLLENSGSVGVIPTDTVYGLVAKATDQKAIKRLYSLKERENKPGTVIAASVDQLVDLGLKRRYLSAVAGYWPGPISIIIPCGLELNYLHLGKFGIAARLPKDDHLIALLSEVGPLLSSSANLTGQPPANTIKEAIEYFHDRIDFYVDGGDLSGTQPSTIVRVVDDAIEVIRPGAFKIS